MKYVAAIIIAIALLSILFGAPNIGSSGLSWDNSTTTARIQAKHNEEMARIEAQDADSERWHDTARWLIVAGGAVAVVVVGGRTLRHRAEQRTAVQLAALPLLASRPNSYLDCVEGTWYVVDDKAAELIRVPRRLTG